MDSIATTYIRYGKLLEEYSLCQMQKNLLNSKIEINNLEINALSSEIKNLNDINYSLESRINLFNERHKVEVKILKRKKIKNLLTGGLIGGVIATILLSI